MVQDLFLQGKDWFAQQSFEQIHAGASQQMCSCCVRHKSAMGTLKLALRAMPLWQAKIFCSTVALSLSCTRWRAACAVVAVDVNTNGRRPTRVNTRVWPAACFCDVIVVPVSRVKMIDVTCFSGGSDSIPHKCFKGWYSVRGPSSTYPTHP